MTTETSTTPTEWRGMSNRGTVVMGISSTFVGLAVVSVALRLFARWRQFGRFLADDFSCVISMVLKVACFTSVVVMCTGGGLGWHIGEVPPAQVAKFLKWFYAAEILYAAVSTFYKLSVLLLYRHIFGQVKNFNRAIWAVVGLVIAWGMVALWPAVFQCSPIKKAWYPTSTPGHCIDTYTWILGNGIANLLIDAIILVLPLPLIWRLQLSNKKKIALTGMFLLGAIVCVASIIRVITALAKLNFTDPTYNLYSVTIWSEVEESLGIICACLPTLRLLFSSKARAKNESAYYSSSGKTTLDTSPSSKAQVDLTGWNSTSAYTEIEVTTGPLDDAASHPHFQSKSTLAQGRESTERPPRSSGSAFSRSNEIFITKEVTVQENLGV